MTSAERVLPSLAIHPDPYEYLIDLDPVSFQKRLPLLPASTKSYLRMLGRTDAVQRHIPRPSAAKIAALELGGGWRILKLAADRSDVKRRRGVFFEADKITSEAVQTCPRMPYLYGLRRDRLSELLEFRSTLDYAEDMKDYIPQHTMSPYARKSRNLAISNAIVPLPEFCSIDESHELWPELIFQMYGTAHPVFVVANNFDINVDDNEKLILAARNEDINPAFFQFPNRNAGLDPEADLALYRYYRDVLYLDFGSDDDSD